MSKVSKGSTSSDITVNKEKFDKLLRRTIASKPVTSKELVKKSKLRSDGNRKGAFKKS